MSLVRKRSVTISGHRTSYSLEQAFFDDLVSIAAERGLTLVGFSVSNIDRDGAQQLELPFPPAPTHDVIALDDAVDQVRQRYGNAAVMRGVLLGRDPGLEMPLLPD